MGVLLVFLVFWRWGRYIVPDQQGDKLQGTLQFFRSDLIFPHLSTHPKTHTQTMVHHHHHPPLSRRRQQRQQHSNGGDKDVTVTPVTTRWRQRDSRAVAEEIAWRQQ